jgi:hypothetical protein
MLAAFTGPKVLLKVRNPLSLCSIEYRNKRFFPDVQEGELAIDINCSTEVNSSVLRVFLYFKNVFIFFKIIFFDIFILF